jgi:hypothetical protein
MPFHSSLLVRLRGKIYKFYYEAPTSRQKGLRSLFLTYEWGLGSFKALWCNLYRQLAKSVVRRGNEVVSWLYFEWGTSQWNPILRHTAVLYFYVHMNFTKLFNKNIHLIYKSFTILIRSDVHVCISFSL